MTKGRMFTINGVQFWIRNNDTPSWSVRREFEGDYNLYYFNNNLHTWECIGNFSRVNEAKNWAKDNAIYYQ